jgi:hypothetical protein
MSVKNSIIGIGAIVKWNKKYYKVASMFSNSALTDFVILEQKGKLVAQVKQRAIKFNGTVLEVKEGLL